MAITQKRLQQIIQEEVARLLREEDEKSAAETALGALQSAQYDNAVAALMNRAEADAARAKADGLEGELAQLAQSLGLEDRDPAGQSRELRSIADQLTRSAEAAGTKSEEAAAALEQVSGVLGAVSAQVAPEEEEEEAPEEEPETLSEGAVLERWNKLAFGRKLL